MSKEKIIQTFRSTCGKHWNKKIVEELILTCAADPGLDADLRTLVNQRRREIRADKSSRTVYWP